MNILDISCWPNSEIFQHFSDFHYSTYSSKNNHKLGLTPPTDMVHHSIKSWEPGEDPWAGGLRRLQRSKKWWEMKAIMFYARQCNWRPSGLSPPISVLWPPFINLLHSKGQIYIGQKHLGPLIMVLTSKLK